MSISFERLKSSLTKTRNNLFKKISDNIFRTNNVDDKLFEIIEEQLLACDIGPNITDKIISDLRTKIKSVKDVYVDTIKNELKEILEEIIMNNTDTTNNIIKDKPYIIMILGINGSGKTTTIGKLAYFYRNQGYKVLVVAADTYRAAANDQLKIWVEKSEVSLFKNISHSPASVVYDAVSYAKISDFDIVLIDTAGRLHNNKNLMEEVVKISNVTKKIICNAPHKTFLIIDSTTGQNSLKQVEEFTKSTNIDGLIISKLDGTAKGGFIFSILNEIKIPIEYLGIGEKIDDLQKFQAKEFINALLV